MTIQLIVGQGITHNRIFLRKCARWSYIEHFLTLALMLETTVKSHAICFDGRIACLTQCPISEFPLVSCATLIGVGMKLRSMVCAPWRF
jgi:hypothetical protein